MPRVIRKNGAKARKVYKPWNAREALPLLLEDFGNRCAYSLVHKDTIADSQMHVDHFDPRKKKACGYDNLFPAYEPCNHAKLDSWPVKSQERAGMRFLNPCVEDDYDAQIFEDPETHELVPAPNNPAAEFHVDVIDLNNRNLVGMRRDRALKARVLEIGILEGTPVGAEIAAKLREDLKVAIPPIKPPPKS